MARTGIPGLFWPPFWTTSCCDLLQPLFSVGGSAVTARVSLYFDDATATDLKSSKGSGQFVVNQFFSDNVAAVMALARGCSSNPDVAKLGHLIHLALLPCGPRATGNTPRARAIGPMIFVD